MSDLRGAILACPACNGPMAELTLPAEARQPEVTVDVCGGCRGVWFDWFDGETSAIARRLDTGGLPASPSGADGRCPRDGTRLEGHPYLDHGPLVDRCPTCLGLFAGRDVISALQRFHERMDVQSPEPIERASLLSRLWHAFVG